MVAFFTLQLDTAPAIVIGEAMQPRSFPIFLTALIALLNALLVYQLVNGSRMPRLRQSPQTWITMLLMIVFYGLTTYVDMFVGLIVVIFVMSLAWGERLYWLVTLVAEVTPANVFFLFDLVLKIRFPRGVLTGLYYG